MTNQPVWDAIRRKTMRARWAALNMGEKCPVCAALLQPHDLGADPEGRNWWTATCCGFTQTFEEIPPTPIGEIDPWLHPGR